MALSNGYGVAVGTFLSFTRDDPDSFGHWYHGKLRITTPTGVYEAALDVDTPSGVGISYRVVDGRRISQFPALAPLAPGFHVLAQTSTSGALDYVRSPLLQDGWVVGRIRRWGRLWRAGWLDLVLGRLRTWLGWFLEWRSYPWVASNGDNALNVLEALLPSASRILVFGEPFSSGLGVHNVHQNQGDPPGPHFVENGVWQDGAVLVERADGTVTIWQVKFNPQSLNTDDAGHPR